ncbi:hypothetical protein [Nocardioides sp.]|uniref:hypothetical protein n=1 Tax=Nocardioides sp. TaxID=35761 RepID=UPI002ED2C6C2
MSELARRAIGSWAARRSEESERGSVRVEIRLGDELAPAADPIQDLVQESLTGLTTDLGIGREALVEVTHERPRRPPLLTASLDGHPVAHLEADRLGGEEIAPAVARAVVGGVLRRLSLMADGFGSPAGSYVVGLGCRPGTERAGRGSAVEAAEVALDERDDAIVVELSAATLRRVGRGAQHDVAKLREDELHHQGVMYPDVHARATDDPPGTVRLRLNDVTLPPYSLDPDAAWKDVVDLMAAEVAVRRHWFLRQGQVSARLDDDLVYLQPDLVAVIDANFSRAALTACLRELVRSGRRIRNLPRILWFLLEQADPDGDPDTLRLAESPLVPKSRYAPRADPDPLLLAAHVRKLANEEAWRLGNYRMPRGAVRLAAETEHALTRGGADPEELARAEWAAVRAVAAEPAERVITRSVRAIAAVRDTLQALPRPPRVTASQELPPDADLTQFRVLDEPSTEAWS